jgi:hypothetical protein
MEITIDSIKKQRDEAVAKYMESIKNAPTWKTARYNRLIGAKPKTDSDLTNELTSFLRSLNMVSQAYFDKDVWNFPEESGELEGGAID